MLTIKTTGVEDYLDGSANIKALIIGGPGAGKTRSSSFWPKPIFFDCENGRGSLADRRVPYVEIKSSKDMLDGLEYLKQQERIPKAQRDHQTVVIDTADSFQRIIKDEWVTMNKAGSFTGFDAWGYLDTKMQLLFTRLLNLDYNVVVLVHYKDKTYKDGDNTVRELTLQLQGAIAEQIFNDFGLVGWLGTYWAPVDGERVQKRGLTFQPTPDKPFLKDRFNATPKWMEIDFSDNDYQQLWNAFYNRPEFEALQESVTVGEIPDANDAPPAAPVAAPKEGGPLPPGPRVDIASIPLDRQTKEQLLETAKQMGITVRGNTLKAEIVSSIEAARAAQASTSPSGPAPSASATEATTPSAPSTPTTPNDDPWAPPTSSPSPEQSAKPAAEPSVAAPPAAESASASSEEETVALVESQLGGEVISEEKTDAPTTPQPAAPSTPVAKPAAPQGPSACADCGDDLSEAWTDPAKKNQMRMSFVKHRRYLCTTCYEKN